MTRSIPQSTGPPRPRLAPAGGHVADSLAGLPPRWTKEMMMDDNELRGLVKPLDWHLTSESPVRYMGHPVDVCDADYLVQLLADSPDVWGWEKAGMGWEGREETLEAAKAAAQADYADRILAALDLTRLRAERDRLQVDLAGALDANAKLYERDTEARWRPMPAPNDADLLILRSGGELEYISAEENDYAWRDTAHYALSISLGIDCPVGWMLADTARAWLGGAK